MANLSIAIVGLPNVGKSTLFNALLKKKQALSANFPFATIEPNKGIVPVEDARLKKLAQTTRDEDGVADMPPIKYATVEFVDIAGLVKGAAEGAGLGNKFLSHIRETSIIAHVVRAFTDDNVIREGSSDPENDYAVIQMELLLADLQTARSHESRVKSKGEKILMQKIIGDLDAGIPVREMKFLPEEIQIVKSLFFLTLKPEIIVLNVSEDDESLIQQEILKKRYSRLLQIAQNKIVVVSAKIEEEIAGLSGEDQKAFLKELGLAHSGLERLIAKSYETLGLISFLTCGAKEVRAWTIKRGTDAQNAAGVIHTDFIKKFIKAEVVLYDDFIEFGGWKGSREKGKTRLEGRDYIVKDGDVIEFKIGT